jgi:hypothetical protein
MSAPGFWGCQDFCRATLATLWRNKKGFAGFHHELKQYVTR